MKEINGGDNIKNEDNKKDEDNRTSELETIFKEHWNHARHCENERLWFTNIYAAVVAAILVFTGEAGFGQPTESGPTLLLSLFGLILSVLGFMVVITLSLGYAHHETDITMIFYCWDKMEFYTHPKKPFFFFDVQRYFYEITIALFSVLFLFYAFQSWTSLTVFHNHLVWPIPVLIIFVIIERLYRLKWKQYFDECWRFEKALRNDTERRYMQDWPNLSKDKNFRGKIIKDAKKRRKK